MNELDIIAQTRSEVLGRKVPTGENLFLSWGYPSVVVLLIEFAAAMMGHSDWCAWLWIGIPLVGAPLMAYFIRRDYARTGHRTLDANIALQMWLFVGLLSCLGGFTLGFSGLFETSYCTFQGLLISIGCFVTGVILRYRPKTTCGLLGAILSFSCLFFQGDLWPWQLLMAALVAVVTLIIPGHLFNRYIKNYGHF